MNLSNLRLIVAGGLTLLWLFLGCTAPSDDYLVEIDGKAIGEAEFRLYLNRNIARTYNHYYQKWGANPHTGFWETMYGNTTPRSYINEMVIAQLVQIKTQQQLAVEMEITKDFNYDSLQRWWMQDNAERKFKKENGGIVYGPVERSFEDFYDYFHAGLFNKLEETIFQKRFTPRQGELQAYYELNKNKWFQYIPQAEVEYLEFSYVGSSEKEYFIEMARQAETLLLKEGDMSAIKVEFPHGKYQHQTFAKINKVLGEEDVEQQLHSWALGLPTGEIKIFTGSYMIYLMRSIQQAEPKVYPYSEIERDVLWYYRNNHYEEVLDSLRQNAKVRVNEERLAGLNL